MIYVLLFYVISDLFTWIIVRTYYKLGYRHCCDDHDFDFNPSDVDNNLNRMDFRNKLVSKIKKILKRDVN